MTEKPSGQSNRGANRLEVAGWNRDDELFHLTACNLRELVGHGIDVPVRSKFDAGPEHTVLRRREMTRWARFGRDKSFDNVVSLGNHCLRDCEPERSGCLHVDD